MLTSQLQAELRLQRSTSAMQQPEPLRGRTKLHNSKAGKAELPFHRRRTEEIINGLHLLYLSRVLSIRAYRVEEVLKATGTLQWVALLCLGCPRSRFQVSQSIPSESTQPFPFLEGRNTTSSKQKGTRVFVCVVLLFFFLLLRNAGFITVPFVC